ncbi:MAG TPA: NAD-dependent epimerase/dehydratase family protein [Thermodesulfovibrionales bacterium]|nr:NAD-dependent epimerase/dehydratase family protein [Thermodesulfovibrionales bacterium]
MAKTLFITGGSGFIGNHLLEALRKEDFGIRCLARNAARAVRFTEKGFEAHLGNVLDRESLNGCMAGVDTVVHLVGIIQVRGEFTFERVHVKGTENLVNEAVKAGVKRFFYQSSLGVSLSSSSQFLGTKAKAEDLVRESGIPYTIFRPSLVIGEQDGFTDRLKALIQLGPVVPVAGGGNAKFQPMDVDDWVRCFISVINKKDAIGKTYEFGGPEHLTQNEIVTLMMDAMGIKRRIVHLPVSFARAGVPFLGLAQGLGKFIGKKIPAVTAEQLLLLGIDNICDVNSVKNLFGFDPIAFKESIRKFIPKG